jgi:hypothetical protein
VKRHRVALTALGGVAVVAATTYAESDAVATAFATLESGLGSDYFLVGAVGVGGLLVGAAAVASGRASNLEQATMPDAEEPVSAPPPGAGFDRHVGGPYALLPVVGHSRRDAVRERLRTAAVETLCRVDSVTRSEAEAEVDRGTWTDDPDATRFLSAADDPPSPLARVASFAVGEPWFRRAATRTAEEIASYGERR